MEKHLTSTPRDIFLHLLNIATFYISVISYITLLIQYINVLLPDPLEFHLAGSLETIFWSTSVLIVAFPVYLFSAWLMERDFAHTPAMRELKVRKWLLYATLFISALTVIGDLIALVFNFLKGELTVNFFLKVLVVLAVAAVVFGYYFWDLQGKKSYAGLTRRRMAWIVSLVVLASIAAGFILAGTPQTQRARRFDEERVNHLQTLQGQIIDYWSRKGALPEDLAVLSNDINGFQPPADPETGRPYDFRVLSPTAFELCADFQTSALDSTQYRGPKSRPAMPYRMDGSYVMQTWDHDLGHTCFTREIDPEMYRPRSDTEKPILPPPL